MVLISVGLNTFTSKYMKKRKMLAAGGIVTTIFIAGVSQTFAQTAAHVRSRQNFTTQHTELTLTPGSRPSLDTIALNFGINADDVREELRTGKTPKEILLEQGISQAQIKKLFKRTAVVAPKVKKISMSDEV
jgi:hypothetical protein